MNDKSLKRDTLPLLKFVVIIPIIFGCLFLLAEDSFAQEAIPTPESLIGFKIGSDYHLADYEQSIKYFKKLDAVSDHLRLIKVGNTAFGRPWYLAVISSPENLDKLEHYREIAQKIAHPEDAGLSDAEALSLAKEGKAFVDINGGLHATEVAGAQQDIALAYRLLSSQDDPQVKKIFENTILFLWPTLNPDGQDIVVNWYRKIKDTKYKDAPLHELYEKYVGHDNNRDGYMLNTQESRVITHSWRHWEPQIIHVHHQKGGSAGDRIWLPPFAPPVGIHNPPLILAEVNALGMIMDVALQSNGLTGVTHMGTGFDAYYAGYIDYLPVNQNIASYWTEVSGNAYANPHYYEITDLPQQDRDLRTQALYTHPWKGGWWRLSDQVEYMVTISMAVLNYASKNSEQLLYNRYQAGSSTVEYYKSHAPYAYIVPQNQRDPMAAVELLKRLAFHGIKIQQLTQDASFNGRMYPAGTWVIPTTQAFAQVLREVLDMQHYPDIRQYEDGPLELPYDAAGWTLPYTMDVNVITAKTPLPLNFKEAMRPVQGEAVPWESDKNAGFNTNPVAAGITLPPISISGSGTSLSLTPKENNTYTLINRALADGGTVRYQMDRSNKTAGGRFVVSDISKDKLKKWVSELAIHGNWTNKPSGKAIHPRIGIYSSWIPNMDEGWTRWLLDKYEFSYKRIRNDEVKAGKLAQKYDVIILASQSSYRSYNPIMNGFSEERMPAPYAGGIGAKGVKALDSFVKSGGTLIALNQSTEFAINQLKLPVRNTLKGLSRDKFFVGSSVLRAVSNTSSPIMAGMPEDANIFFSRSPAFSTVSPEFKGDVLAQYSFQGSPLLSGFLKGESYLKGEAAALNVQHGEGHVVLFGFSPQWRGQPFGTFRMLFNAVFLGDME